MEPNAAIDLGRTAITTALTLGAPVLLAGLVVGLFIGMLQALTQIQDQTISSVPKIVAMLGLMSLLLPWMIELMMDYSYVLISTIPQRLMGG
jgi:flagellar biosynthetic protein FliQ